jgi:hypothetical protein
VRHVLGLFGLLSLATGVELVDPEGRRNIPSFVFDPSAFLLPNRRVNAYFRCVVQRKCVGEGEGIGCVGAWLADG